MTNTTATPAPTAAHTPGPWTAELYSDGAFSIVAEKEGGGVLVLASRSRHFSRAEEMHANARLFAASPVLLEALTELVEAITGATTLRERSLALRDAKAAIALATGAE